MSIEHLIPYLPNIGHGPSKDRVLQQCSGWTLTRSWKPRNCFLSDKPVWGKQCYMGTRHVLGFGQEHFWIEKNEYLIWLLKG